MNQLEFAFEPPLWEQELKKLPRGSQLDGARFLTMMETQSEEELHNALSFLEEREILLNIDSLGEFASSHSGAVRLRLEKELVSQGKLPQGLEENDPLRLYLEEIARLPEDGDVQALAEAYYAGQQEVLPKLTDCMLHEVVRQACLLAGRGVLLMDLMQEGGLGLWQGILSYSGGAFEEHCRSYIQRYLNRAVVLQAREFGIGQKLRQAMEDYRAVDERLLGDLGRTPTTEEMAEALHLTVAETDLVAQMLETARRMYMAKKEPEPEEEQLAETQAVEDTAYFQMRQRISELLSGLQEQEAKLLSLRFGLDSGLPMSSAEVGKALNLTPDEVSAIEAAALAKLRNEE